MVIQYGPPITILKAISSVSRYLWPGNGDKADIGFHSNVHSHLSNGTATSTLILTQFTFCFTSTPLRLPLPPPLPLFRTFYLMVAQNIAMFLFQFTLFTFHLSQAGCQKESRNSWHGTHRQWPWITSFKHALNIVPGSLFLLGFIRVLSLLVLFQNRIIGKTQYRWFLLGFVRVDVKYFCILLVDTFQESWILLGFIRFFASSSFSKLRKGLFQRLRNEIRRS